MDSRMMWIWLQAALGYGSPLAGTLLSHFSSPEEAYAADDATYRCLGFPAAVRKRLADKSMENARGILWQTLSEGDWLLTPADEAYPALLRGIHSPPLVLYGRGALPDFERQPTIAVVGTRNVTDYGVRVTAALADGLARGGALLVSGGAQGGDAVALSAALDAGGLTVSVQACGLDIDYPAPNAPLRRRMLQNEGALLTEYPYGVRVGKGTFHVRNRLLSGLALGVCVTQAPKGSGALITARYAREQGRDVFAVPGDLTSPHNHGSNALIQQGAKLVCNAREILEEYETRYPHILDLNAAGTSVPLPAKSAPPALRVAQPKKETPTPAPPPTAPLPDGVSDTARAVHALLTEQPQPVDEIAAAANLPMPQVLAALTELELFGAAVSGAGQQYRR